MEKIKKSKIDRKNPNENIKDKLLYKQQELLKNQSSLDSLYVEIKILHERREYRKAHALYKKVESLQREQIKIQNSLSFYSVAERLNKRGILCGTVKRVTGQLN